MTNSPALVSVSLLNLFCLSSTEMWPLLVLRTVEPLILSLFYRLRCYTDSVYQSSFFCCTDSVVAPCWVTTLQVGARILPGLHDHYPHILGGDFLCYISLIMGHISLRQSFTSCVVLPYWLSGYMIFSMELLQGLFKWRSGVFLETGPHGNLLLCIGWMAGAIHFEIPPFGPFLRLVLKESLGPVHFSWDQDKFLIPPVMLCLGSQPINMVHLSRGQQAMYGCR